MELEKPQRSINYTLAKMRLPFQVNQPYPTIIYYALAIGFNVESVVIQNVRFQMWDLGGQSSIR